MAEVIGFLIFLNILFMYFYTGKEREKGRERNISVWLPLEHPLLGTWPTAQACALTGNQTFNPLVRRPVLNPLSHTSQGRFLIFNISESLMKILIPFRSDDFTH